MTDVKMLLVFKNGSYQISRCNVMIMRHSNGSSVTMYLDSLTIEGAKFYLNKVDRKNNVLVYEEGHKVEVLN